jgi:hypothetical protein
MIKRVVTFVLGWWVTDKAEYAEAAIKQIRIWFLNKDTLMYPNLEYTQTIPNFKKGSSAGIIDINQIDQLVNALGLIEMSSLWLYEDSVKMKAWCAEMVNWLVNSEHGKKERINDNNHGVYYDKILISLASFAGDKQTVYEVIKNFPQTRIFKQVTASGEMPHEMSRANAYHYLQWSLNGFIAVAEIAKNYGVDLWSISEENSGSISKAIDWSIGFIDGTKEWKYSAKFDETMHNFVEIFWRSSLHFGEQHTILLDNFLLPIQNNKYMEAHLYNIIYPREVSLDNNAIVYNKSINYDSSRVV